EMARTAVVEDQDAGADRGSGTLRSAGCLGAEQVREAQAKAAQTSDLEEPAACQRRAQTTALRWHESLRGLYHAPYRTHPGFDCTADPGGFGRVRATHQSVVAACYDARSLSRRTRSSAWAGSTLAGSRSRSSTRSGSGSAANRLPESARPLLTFLIGPA